MPRRLTLAALLSALLILLLTACEVPGLRQEEEPTPLPVVTDTREVVTAEAFIVPLRDVTLSFEMGGVIVELMVEEGEAVQAGQVVARLDDQALQAAVTVREAALTSAQARLERTQAGPTAEQIAQAEAAVAQAEAALAVLIAGPTDTAIDIAEANLNVLRANFNQTVAAARSEDLEAAAAALLQAEANQRQAQTAYDAISFAYSMNDNEPQVIALEQANQGLSAAQASFDALLAGATSEQIAIAQAQVGEGQAALDQARAGATPEQIAQGQAAVLKAEATLASLMSGATPEQIAVSEAEVRRAEAGLQRAQEDLAKAQIKVPFSGTITRIDFEAGEYVNPGQPVMTLADLSTWLVETDDLTEIQVVEIRPGQAADVIPDALPDETFPGTVTRVRSQSETKAGDVTYTVEIELDEPGASDPRLRWGLTVQTEITVGN